ncbi:MAG: hypothetical protein ABEJ81_03225 [Haloferacaceae archaeon]
MASISELLSRHAPTDPKRSAEGGPDVVALDDETADDVFSALTSQTITHDMDTTRPSPSTKMTRRTILATAPTAAVLGLAGCTGNSPAASNASTGGTDTGHGGGGGGQVGEGHAPKARIEMESVSTTDMTSRMTMTVSQQTTHADLVSALARNGSATVEATSEPLPTARPITFQKTVYGVSKNVTDRTSATQYTVAFSDASSAADSSDVVEYSDLPVVDRTKLAAAGFDNGASLGVATTLTYTKAEQSKSALVPPPSKPIVTWDSNDRARISIKNRTSVTVSTYHYTAKEIASDAHYGSRMKNRYGFTLSNVSSDEAAILTTAIQQGRGYTVSDGHALPDAFRSISKRFEGHTPVSTSRAPSPSGEYLVSYQGTTYWTHLLLRAS